MMQAVVTISGALIALAAAVAAMLGLDCRRPRTAMWPRILIALAVAALVVASWVAMVRQVGLWPPD